MPTASIPHFVLGPTSRCHTPVMFSNQTAEVSLDVPVRSLDSVRADKDEPRFLAGSCSDSDNHLHVLRFHSEVNQLGHDAKLHHPTGSVSKICSSPSDKSMVLTVPQNGRAATLWKMPVDILNRTAQDTEYDEDDNHEFPATETLPMEEMATLQPANSSNPDESILVDMQWRGAFDEESSPNGNVLLLNQSGSLTQWDVEFGAAESTRSITDVSAAASTWDLPPRMAWDPHNVDTIAVSSGTSIKLIDSRADTSVPDGTVQSFNRCHRYGITDLHFNPNKPNVLATAGKDALVKFWDLRSAKQPLLALRGGHRHWVSQVSYNPFHDQLVISAGTDSTVNLWRISTISSAPLLTLDDDMLGTPGALDADDPNTPLGNGGTPSETSGANARVAHHEHMDSVYATAWSAADAWIYASASYDGKVVVNHVPSKEKYKILL